MTGNTYQQIEILTPTQDEPAICRLPTRDSAEQGKSTCLIHMSYRELQKSKEKEREGTNCGQNTHVTLNWLVQLKSSVGCFTSTYLAQDRNDHEMTSIAV